MKPLLTEYEKYNIDRVLVKINETLEAMPVNSKGYDYYKTIQETLIMLSFSLQENMEMRRSFDNLCARVKIMERLLDTLLRH